MIEKNDPRLTAYLLDELTAEEAAIIESELANSDDLQAHVDELRGTIEALHRVFDEPHTNSATAELTAEQLSAIDAASTGPTSELLSNERDSKSRWRGLAIAALVLYAIGVSVLNWKDRFWVASTPMTPEPTAILDSETETTQVVEEANVSDSYASYQVMVPKQNLNEPRFIELSDELETATKPVATLPADSFQVPTAENGHRFGVSGAEPQEEDKAIRWDDHDAPVAYPDANDWESLSRIRLSEEEPNVSDGPVWQILSIENSPTRFSNSDALDAINPETVEQRLHFEQRLLRRSAGVPATSEPQPTRPNIAAVDGEGERDDLFVKLPKLLPMKLQKKAASPKTWKPASAATNRARLSVGHHDDLALTARDTYVRIDGFRARVFFDLYYYNDRPQQLEGQFLLRLPDDASLHYFAFGPTNLPADSAPTPTTNKPRDPEDKPPTADSEATRAIARLRKQIDDIGSDLARRATDANFAAEPSSVFGAVKSARVAPRQKAALAYEETVRRRVDPALVEWAGPGIFQTKVFPLLPNRLHRIVIGYDVSLVDDGDDRLFKLQLPEGEAGGRVEFDVAAAPGTTATVSPDTDAFVSSGRAYYRIENAAPQDYTVRLTGTDSVSLHHAGGVNDEYFATRLIANLPDQQTQSSSPQAVFLLDTSWSDRPAAFARRLQLMQAILKSNRDSIKEFAVLFFNVEQRWWRNEFSPNDEDNLAALLNTVNEMALEGATDLHSALLAAKQPDWLTNAPELSPDLFLLSDAAATWGKTDLPSLGDTVSDSPGVLFAYHLSGHRSDRVTLQWLADASGGAVFDLGEASDMDTVARAHRSRPWQIADVQAKGADEILIQGSTKTVYPNQPLIVVGKGRVTNGLTITFQRGDETETLDFTPRIEIASPAAARLYGQVAVESLEPYGDSLSDVTVSFARYFRVPGRTCSMVMLETDEDYQRFGVNVAPEEDLLVIASTAVAVSIQQAEAEQKLQRTSPRTQFMAWVNTLESASLLKVPTALRLAMKRLPETAFDMKVQPLQCRSWQKEHLGEGFQDELNLDTLGFETVMEEADRKLIAFGADDALKTASTLVDAKPGDVDTLRSVAFRAVQWQRSDQAAPLFWRIAQARPHQPQCLLLLARSLADSDDIDSAIVCYELVNHGKWNQRWAGAKQIAQVELMRVLEQVVQDRSQSVLSQYAAARLHQLREQWGDSGLDIAVVMHWNTDRTDVDLHITEPSGEICYYSNPQSASGGRMTQDITEGLGPEMYSLAKAPQGDFRIEAKYYNNDANRTQAPTETLLTVFRNLGRENMSAITKRVTLTGKGEKQLVTVVNNDK